MQRPSSTPGEPTPGRPALSDEVISPDAPPDAKDGFRLLVDGATAYAVFALSPTGVVSTWNRGPSASRATCPTRASGRTSRSSTPTSNAGPAREKPRNRPHRVRVRHRGLAATQRRDPLLDQHALTVAPATTSARIDSFSPSHLLRDPDRWFQAKSPH